MLLSFASLRTWAQVETSRQGQPPLLRLQAASNTLHQPYSYVIQPSPFTTPRHPQGMVALKSVRDLDALRTRLGVVVAEAEGLRSTMLDMQSRHIEQVNRWVGSCAHGARRASAPSSAAGKRHRQPRIQGATHRHLHSACCQPSTSSRLRWPREREETAEALRHARNQAALSMRGEPFGSQPSSRLEGAVKVGCDSARGFG